VKLQVMKFSFQMVFIAFVVTLAHLVALAALSPVGSEFSRSSSTAEVKTTVEPTSVTFPVANEIPLTATLEQPDIVKTEKAEPEAVSIPRAERISSPKPAELVEVSLKKSESLPQAPAPQPEASGPHQVRQISPKPRS